MDVAALVVKSLVLYALAEHQAGHARTVCVDIDDGGFSVSDDGRGHAIHRDIEGTPYLALIYEQVQYPFGGSSPGPVQPQGIGMSLINALCIELEVLVQKADCEHRLHYIGGRLHAHERTSKFSAQTGNRIRGRIDPAFQSTQPSRVELQSWLEAIQKAAPALALQFNGSFCRASQRSGA